tara:strand:- start:409 stop:693 length:285 start_codon:yes stop_codon:yes gene_type:complete
VSSKYASSVFAGADGIAAAARAARAARARAARRGRRGDDATDGGEETTRAREVIWRRRTASAGGGKVERDRDREELNALIDRAHGGRKGSISRL